MVTSNHTFIHLFWTDAKILKFPSDMTITEGEGVYFKIKVSGVPQPTVTWYHDGEPVKADYAREVEEDGSLAIPSTELKHSGVYKAVVANQHGSEEREVKLTVSEEGGATRAVQGDIVSTRPIPIPEFGKYTAELHANSNQPFRDLFQVCTCIDLLVYDQFSSRAVFTLTSTLHHHRWHLVYFVKLFFPVYT